MFTKNTKEKKESKNPLLPSKKNEVDSIPYEQKIKAIPLHLVTVIVNHGQADFFMDGFSELGISLTLHVLGKGTAPQEMYDMLGVNTKKDVVFAIVKEPDLETVKNFILERFNVSSKAKGIAFTTKINSVVGVLIYKFLTNSRDYRTRTETKKDKKMLEKEEKKKQKALKKMKEKEDGTTSS